MRELVFRKLSSPRPVEALRGLFNSHPEMTILDLRAAPLVETSFAHIFQALHGNTTIRQLFLDHTLLEQYATDALSGMLENNGYLRTLSLDARAFYSALTATRFAQVLTINQSLLHISFSGVNCQRPVASSILLTGLIGNKNLLSFALGYVTLSSDFSKFLIDCLSRNTTLKNLDLSQCSFLTSEIVDPLLAQLRNHPSLCQVNLGGGYFSKASTSLFIEALENNKRISSVILSGIAIEEADFGRILQSATKNVRLKKLDFSYCAFNNNNMSFLVDLLNTNKSLECINLKGITIIQSDSQENLELLFSALTKNTNLKSVNLSGIFFIRGNIRYLTRLLRENGHILDLDISDINVRGYRNYQFEVARAITDNHTLRCLIISEGLMDSWTCMEWLSTWLSKNTQLMSLSFQRGGEPRGLCESALELFSSALNVNNTLQEFNAPSLGVVSSEDYDSFLKAVSSNKTLLKFALRTTPLEMPTATLQNLTGWLKRNRELSSLGIIYILFKIYKRDSGIEGTFSHLPLECLIMIFKPLLPWHYSDTARREYIENANARVARRFGKANSVELFSAASEIETVNSSAHERVNNYPCN